MKHKLGFTLIELLVVISVIGVLISIVAVNFTTAQKQARDSRRKQDILAIQNAMEQYFATSGTAEYPDGTNNALAFEAGSIPEDPKSPSMSYDWGTQTTSSYCICAELETSQGNSIGVGCNWDDTASADHFCVTSQQ